MSADKPLTDAELAEDERILSAATPGLWRCWNAYGPCEDGLMRALRIGNGDENGFSTRRGSEDIEAIEADFTFIVIARNRAPLWLAEIRRLREELTTAMTNVTALAERLSTIDDDHERELYQVCYAFWPYEWSAETQARFEKAKEAARK